MAKLFFSYSHRDEGLRDQLETQLSMLKRQGVIETWHDRRITAGEEFGGAIDRHVEGDDVILLLVSPDFLASDYCYEIEMTRALQRHEAGEAVVIPVILRACEWTRAPFGKLMATPPDGRAVTQWPDKDQAFLEVAKAIRSAVERLGGNGSGRGAAASQLAPATGSPGRAFDAAHMLTGSRHPLEPAPRSSNLALAKQFSDRDKDAFRIEAFDYVASYFEQSLAELGKRNRGVEGMLRRVDANRFFATAYRDGKAVSRMTVFMGGVYRENGISHTQGETMDGNSFNETLSIEADDQSLFLRSLGMSSGRSETKLTFEGAAEMFWSTFIAPLQRR